MKINSLMSPPVAMVKESMPLVDAVNLMEKIRSSALPVVDGRGKLVGLLSEKHLIMNDNYIHIKTLIKLLGEFEYYKKDTSAIKEELSKLWALKVSDLMDSNPKTLPPNAEVETATKILGDSTANLVPVVDSNGMLIGTFNLSNLTKLYGINLRRQATDAHFDANIKHFMRDFEQQFLLVSRFRTRTWFISSVMFALVGFIVAFMFILRITVQ